MLQDRAMLVALSISQWTARKHDKAISDEVDRTHAARDAGRYNKLLIDKEHLEPLSKLASDIRTYHYKMTLPWGDNGERLLSAALFMDYTQQIRGYRGKFQELVKTFHANYPGMVDAARRRLGNMYDSRDYPPAWQIFDRFDIAVNFTPVPTANDFRVDVGNEAVKAIKSSIEAANQTREAQAMKDCWERVRDVVQKIQLRLADPKAIFRDTLITNASDLVAILPGLNINNDPELTRTAAELDQMLVRPDVIRNNPQVRQKVADSAQAILDKLTFDKS